MSEDPIRYNTDGLQSAILTIRGHKVILDFDLAALYGVEVKRLNEQVRRNPSRFPADFMFRLSDQEVRALRAPWAASNSQPAGPEGDATNWSQIATSSIKHRGRKYRPYAFTEHGAIMAATVLNSPRAVQMSVFVVRAFVRMRQALLTRAEMERRLDQIEKILLLHDNSLRDLYRKILPLLLPAPLTLSKEIAGFRLKERRERYQGCRRHRQGRTSCE